MNKEIMLETLRDALSHLGSANELMGELTSKEKVTAHIEMAKAYSAIAAGFASIGADQAPETVAETKKKKGNKKTAQVEEQETPQETTEQTTPDVPGAPVEEAPQEAFAAEEIQEEPLVSIVDDIWIQFNRPVFENDYDYSAWLMEYVNREGVGAAWINDYMIAFTGGNCTTVEALNEDNVMAFIYYVLDAVEAANQAQ